MAIAEQALIEAVEGTFAGVAHEAAMESTHVLAAAQFTPKTLDTMFSQADEMRRMDTDYVLRREQAGKYVGSRICSLFYQPSTRTRVSFETAAVNFGMGVVSTENAKEFSSAAKGETIEDTIQVLNEYGFDAIVLRHHETGAAARAASVSEAPIINAGDGKGEHPTQSLLDAYTIKESHGRLDGLKIVMGGDLKNGRTVRSLAQVMAMYPGNHMSFVSIPELQMGEDILQSLDDRGASYDETDDMHTAFEDADVIYWTRLQTEHEEKDPEMKAKLQEAYGKFIVTGESLRHMPEHAVIMHPLPRVDEIAVEVDADPRALYFRQAGNGLYVRMAIMDSILKHQRQVRTEQVA